MLTFKHLISILIAMLFWSCKTDNKYHYAIKDFRKPLQPFLTKIVSKGIVMYGDSALRFMATDNELIQLSKSEHPVLRASAFREMLNRKTFNHFDILMNHLDDTATVATNAGEFGIYYRKVSDDILLKAKWKTESDKNKTIHEVITRHNYLQAAYLILSQINPEEKYYSFIKDMATRSRNYDVDIDERGFHEKEYALYGLAKFKKKDDIKIIKDQLSENSWRLTKLSFELMTTFPDSAYMEIFEEYYDYVFYHSICRKQNSDMAIDFINAVATYKNERSATILDSILNSKPFMPCPADTAYMQLELAHAIWNNNCHAYLKLRKQVEPRIREYEKNKIEPMSFDPVEHSIDSTEEKIVWVQ